MERSTIIYGDPPKKWYVGEKKGDDTLTGIAPFFVVYPRYRVSESVRVEQIGNFTPMCEWTEIKGRSGDIL